MGQEIRRREHLSEALVMQAAVVSVLLMAGVCGATPTGCGCDNSAAVMQQNYDGPMGEPMMHGSTRRDSTLWSPVTSGGTVTYGVGPLGRPLYSPLWLIRSRATFYPANYTKPYDYREAFGYPWNGPGPLAPRPLASPPLESSPFMQPPSDPWPEETRAAYLRQSPTRVASKPIASP
jgi:hypothetical protein